MQSSFSAPVDALDRVDPTFQDPYLKFERAERLKTQACLSGNIGRRESARRCEESVSADS